MTELSTRHQVTGTTPRHVAVIMDGNGRWAKSRGLPRTAGHKKGVETLREILNACRDEGIEYLTIYAFSSENWKRPKNEITDLMGLLKLYLQRELKELHANGIRLHFIGDRTLLQNDVREMLEKAENLTVLNARFHLVVALSYGARQELVRAVRHLARQASEGLLTPGEITEETILCALDTAHIPDPDLLIRTGGEQRLSNFLLWQSAYTELYFTETLWPDFSATHFRNALDAYGRRERRFGTV